MNYVTVDLAYFQNNFLKMHSLHLKLRVTNQSLEVKKWSLGVGDEKTVGDEKIEYPAYFEFGSENLAEFLLTGMKLCFLDT